MAGEEGISRSQPCFRPPTRRHFTLQPRSRPPTRRRLRLSRGQSPSVFISLTLPPSRVGHAGGTLLGHEDGHVAERTLFLWNNDHIVSLIAQNRQVILPILFLALERNTRTHWNQAVLNLIINVRKMFSEMDEELFQECQSRFEEEEAKRKATDEKCRLTWERLELVAGFRPVTGNMAILVTSPAAPPLIAAALN